MLKKKYVKPRHAKSTDPSSSFLANRERQALERKAMLQQNGQSGTPIKQVANHLNPLQTAKSPSNIGSGIINVPEGAPVPKTIRITVDSTGLADDTEIVIGADDIYKVKSNTGYTGNPDGMVYSGSAAKNTYPIWLEDVKQNAYIMHEMRLSVTPTEYDNGGTPKAQTQAEANTLLYAEWLYVRGNVQDYYQTDRIDLFDGRDPYQEDNSMAIYTFETEKSRLDAHTCLVIPAFTRGVKMDIRLRITGVTNGRF